MVNFDMAKFADSTKKLVEDSVEKTKDELSKVDVAVLAASAKKLAEDSVVKAKKELANVDMAGMASTAKKFVEESVEKTKHELAHIDLEQTASAMKDQAEKVLQALKMGVAEVDFKQVAADAKAWAVEHPYEAAFHAVSATAFFFPGLIAVPALRIFGFGAPGPLPRSIARGWQASIGNVTKGTPFALLQGAGRGSYYGVRTVNMATRVAAGFFEGLGAILAAEQHAQQEVVTVDASEMGAKKDSCDEEEVTASEAVGKKMDSNCHGADGDKKVKDVEGKAEL